MRAFAAVAQYAALIVIALISLLTGAALLWGRMDRETVAQVPTAQLIAVLALILLPIGAIVALESDRRVRMRQGRLPLTLPPDDAAPAVRPIGLKEWGSMFDRLDQEQVEVRGSRQGETRRHAPAATPRRRRSAPAPSRAASTD